MKKFQELTRVHSGNRMWRIALLALLVKYFSFIFTKMIAASMTTAEELESEEINILDPQEPADDTSDDDTSDDTTDDTSDDTTDDES